MIPSRKLTGARAQDFVAHDELLLPITKTFAQDTGLLHATGSASCFQSVCRSIKSDATSSSPPVPSALNTPRIAPNTPTTHGDHLLVCQLYESLKSSKKNADVKN